MLEVFNRETGLDARDPSTVRQQIEWMREYGHKHGGYSSNIWHGLRNSGIGSITSSAGSGAPGKTSYLSSLHHYASRGSGIAASHFENQMAAVNNYDVDTNVGNVSVHTTGGPSSATNNLAADNMRRSGRVVAANYGLA